MRKPILRLTLCLPVFLIGCLDFRGGPQTDTVEILQAEKSPHGKFVATSFFCSGGGAAGTMYWNANLRKMGEQLDPRDGLLGKHKTWKGFQKIEVRWIDNENLEVSYEPDNSPAYREHTAVREASKHGIMIHYKVKKPFRESKVTQADKRITALWGGESVSALIADLSNVRTCNAYRIDGFPTGKGTLPPGGSSGELPPSPRTSDKPQQLYGYPLISSLVPIDDVSRVELSKVLSDPDTYLWAVTKACEFVPGVALRFVGDNIKVDVLLCFSCDELEIYLNGTLAGHEDFDPRRNDLLRVVKKLFPADETIQALKETASQHGKTGP